MFWMWGKRVALQIFGMGVMTLGIALVTSALLGTTPISTLPYTVAEILGYTFGQMTFVINVVLVALQVVLLRRRFRPINVLQIPVVFVFSMMIDFWMGRVANVEALTDPAGAFAWAMSLTGNLLIAGGIWLQVRSKTIVQPGEGVVIAVTLVTGKNFSTVKIINDVTLVALAGVVAWVAAGHTIGLGWGTLVSAVLVGFLVKVIDAAACKILGLERMT